MTFGQTSIGRTVSRTGQFFKKQLWIWPIVALVVLAILGYGINSAIRRTMEASLKSELQTLLHVETSMLEKWLHIQESNVQMLANDETVRSVAQQLTSVATNADQSGLPPQSEVIAQARLRIEQKLGPTLSEQGFVGYSLIDRRHLVLAATNPQLVGQSLTQLETFLNRSLDGNATVATPFASVTAMKDPTGRLRTGLPTMFACAPIRDQNLQVIAVLAMRIRPEREFTQILQMGRIGETGETYAFDSTGLLVSNSRFDEDLILLGLLPDVEHAQSILSISMRDPGGNLAEGYRPRVRRSELPLTHAAAQAIAGGTGVSVEGHRDYRGVPVVSAWTWLPKYELGIATKVDYAEAFRPLSILRWAFFSLFVLLILSSVAIFAFTLSVARLQREAQKAAVEARKLGQYHLDERIGAGAMGVVYKGHHAMLRRATAIKLLNVENLDDAAIARFEREVQITCKLNHPSTIAIYDYGRTPEGVFYYAMEYLEGVNLQSLVENYGPQPAHRVIHILRQVCGSLYEAHSLGLVHRDIKPANIMLNRRGGESDVVKVLDFGLVKAVDEKQDRSGGLSGTPLYMSPEAIQTPDLVDARSDLYAVGGVAYFLLTGQPVFRATTLLELCQQHVSGVPESPSKRLGAAISFELESAVLACLDKNRARRPQTARDLLALLNRCPSAGKWTAEDSDAWWGRHDRSQPALLSPGEGGACGSIPPSGGAPGQATSTSGFDQTMALPPRGDADVS